MHQRTSPRSTLLLATLLLATALPVAAAKIYKWVDANGVTHYSQSPPNTAQGQEITLGRDRTDTQAAQEQLQERIEELNRRREDREAKKTGSEEELARQRELTQFCRDATARMGDYNSGRTLAERRPDGSYARLAPEEVEQRREKLQSQLDEHCKDF
jgi:TolA-binding protein